MTSLDYSLVQVPLFPSATSTSKCYRVYDLFNNLYLFRKVRSSEDLKDKKLALYIYLNDECRAKGFIYLNDGHSTLYQQGEHTLHELEFDGKELRTN